MSVASRKAGEEEKLKKVNKKASHLPFKVNSVGGNDVSGFDKNPP